MAYSAGDLKCRVELLERVSAENALGERTFTYAPVRKFWAEIVPMTGSREPVEGETERVRITHRFSVRRSAVPELAADMRLQFRGQVYQVKYFYPNYKRTGWLDIFVELVVEDSVRSF
jgi:SPP1 family predicted phage head-tail adaptor